VIGLAATLLALFLALSICAEQYDNVPKILLKWITRRAMLAA
jgi:hypothetical protein